MRGLVFSFDRYTLKFNLISFSRDCNEFSFLALTRVFSWLVGWHQTQLFPEFGPLPHGLLVLWRGDWGCNLASICTSPVAHGLCERKPSLEGSIRLP